MRVLGVVLAGGESRRMRSGHKAMARLGARPLVDHVIARLTPQADDLALSIRGDAPLWERFDLPLISDHQTSSEGPLAGIVAALAYADARDFSYILSTPCDTPFLPHDLKERLQSALARSDSCIAIAASRNAEAVVSAHPSVALIGVGARSNLQAQFNQGTRKLRRAYAECGACTAYWDDQKARPFYNINTPQDLADAGTYLST